MNTGQINIVKKNPTPEDLLFLDDRIYEFNAHAIKNNNGNSFARFIYDEKNRIAAGLTGWTWAGACEITMLWVHEEHRGKGYGRLLLESAEEEARSQQCGTIFISSYTFQAPAFYQKHGYVLEWELHDFPPGHNRCSLVKRFKHEK